VCPRCSRFRRTPPLPDLLDGLSPGGLRRQGGRRSWSRSAGHGSGLAKIQELRAAVDGLPASRASWRWPGPSRSATSWARGTCPITWRPGSTGSISSRRARLDSPASPSSRSSCTTRSSGLGIDFQSAKRHEYKFGRRPAHRGRISPARPARRRSGSPSPWPSRSPRRIADGRGADHRAGQGAARARPVSWLGRPLSDGARGWAEVTATRYTTRSARRSASTRRCFTCSGTSARNSAERPAAPASAVACRECGRGSMEPIRSAMIYGARRHQGNGRRRPRSRRRVAWGSDNGGPPRWRAAGGRRGGRREVVLRVNSPGGSVTASERDLAAKVVRIRAAGKPVVVSMGDVGRVRRLLHLRPCRCDRGTARDDHRGRSGSSSASRWLRDLFGRAPGLSTDTVGGRRKNATMFSSSRPFSEAEWSRIDEWLDADICGFLRKKKWHLARRMSPEAGARAGARAGSGTGAERGWPTGSPTRPAACQRRSPSPRTRAGLPRRRAGPGLPHGSGPARPAATRRVERGPPRRLRAGFAPDGPARRPVRRRLGPGLAVRRRGGTPAVRPRLSLPGVWKNQLTLNGPLVPLTGKRLAGPPLVRRGAAGVSRLSPIADGARWMTIGNDGERVSAPVSLDPAARARVADRRLVPRRRCSRGRRCPAAPGSPSRMLSSSQKVIAGQFAAAGRPSGGAADP